MLGEGGWGMRVPGGGIRVRGGGGSGGSGRGRLQERFVGELGYFLGGVVVVDADDVLVLVIWQQV